MRTFNFADLLEIVAETVPERIALVHGQSELSYAALNEQSKRVAAVLSSHGVGRGDQVGLQLINSPEYLTGFFWCVSNWGGAVQCELPVFTE